MKNILDFFRKPATKPFTATERKINPLYILNEENRQEYIRNGYTIIRNVVDESSIQTILDAFNQITKLPGYFESDKLQTTIVFGEDAHNIAINAVNSVSGHIFKNVLDENLCRFDFGGGIIIKNKGCYFEPHQDCSIIDEYKGTTTYAWIPTVDMTAENGTFFAIPGSHLWAAWQRSSQYPSWPLKKFSKFLWEQMIPLYVNKGDVLLFDSALIHASGENHTDKIRLAFNACIIEKQAEHVQYVLEKDTPKQHIEKFIVDEEYWHKGNLWGRPKGYQRIVEEVVYPEPITEEFLLEQIQKYN
jgi:ectoine hydroxylase-related dioxygenase (phytanoyl-CoA dioxygenase family)